MITIATCYSVEINMEMVTFFFFCQSRLSQKNKSYSVYSSFESLSERIRGFIIFGKNGES